MSETAVSLRGVGFAYHGASVLDDVNIDVRSDDFLAVLGPNGGGKTTLLKLILGLLKPTTGEVRVFGRPPGELPIGYVPQFGSLDDAFPFRVLDVVLTGRLKHNSLLPWYAGEDRRMAREILDKLSLGAFANRRMNQLSGGQRQRALIARALLGQPRLLLLDEPTASVDTQVEADIYELLHELNANIPIMLVTHDLGFVSRYVTRIACLNRSLVCHNASEVSSEDINHLYRHGMAAVSHHCGL